MWLLLACVSTSDKNQDTGTMETGEAAHVAEPETGLDTGASDPCGWDNNQDSDPLSLVGDQECGARVYTQSCSICHMDDGSGGNSGKRLEGKMDLFDDAVLVSIITSGQGTMPPISISSQETADVIVFLRENF